MIEPNLKGLSVGKQCALLSISRSSFYYEPKGESEMNLDLMRVIDKQFLETPFYGVRQPLGTFPSEIPCRPVDDMASAQFKEPWPRWGRVSPQNGHVVNEKRIRRLMRLMCPPLGRFALQIACRATDADLSETQHPSPGNTFVECVRGGKAAKGHKIYPYLLRGLRVDRPNQVWCADITYLPMRRGFLYLVAIRCPAVVCLQTMRGVDWHTRKVLAWRISNTLEAEFCVDALNEAIHKFGPPEIMNTDQGSQFTSFAWTDRLRRSGIRISMDGKGRFLPSLRFCETTAGQRINIFVERLWRSLKYECVYLHAWETGSEAKAGVKKWMDFYNNNRPHSALGGKPPAVIYWQRMAKPKPDQQAQKVA